MEEGRRTANGREEGEGPRHQQSHGMSVQQLCWRLSRQHPLPHCGGIESGLLGLREGGSVPALAMGGGQRCAPPAATR